MAPTWTLYVLLNNVQVYQIYDKYENIVHMLILLPNLVYSKTCLKWPLQKKTKQSSLLQMVA